MTPTSDHLFHVTRPENLGSIRENGLLVNEDRDPTFDGYPVEGRLYFATDESASAFYAQAIKAFLDEDEGETPILLRVPAADIAVHPDEYGNPHDVYSTASVAPDLVEILVDGAWRPLAARSPRPSTPSPA